MREVFREAITEKSLSLPYIQGVSIDILGRIRNELRIPRLGYAAGIITSDGSQHIERNVGRLLGTTQRLREEYSMPIFCASEIFTSEIYAILPEMKLPYEEREQLFLNFWRGILQSGHVTDVFLTPRWRLSRGATDEYQTSVSQGLTIHDLDPVLTPTS